MTNDSHHHNAVIVGVTDIKVIAHLGKKKLMNFKHLFGNQDDLRSVAYLFSYIMSAD